MSSSEYFIRTVEFDTINDIEIYQQYVGDVGHVVWDAAIVLSKYMDSKQFQYDLVNKTVVELGAGTGLVGIVAALKGANAIITDLQEVLPLMQKNITENNKNQKYQLTAKTLKWGEEKIHPSLCHPDFIFIADCIYYEESLEPLINTMKTLATPDTQTFLSYEERDTEQKIKLQNQFFMLLSKFFDVSEIPSCEQDPTYSSPDIHVMHLKLKGD